MNECIHMHAYVETHQGMSHTNLVRVYLCVGYRES